MGELASYSWKKKRAHILQYATHCALCAKPLVPDAAVRSRWSSSIDHIIARELGGTDDLSNLQAAHFGCNSRKGINGHPTLPTSRKW